MNVIFDPVLDPDTGIWTVAPGVQIHPPQYWNFMISESYAAGSGEVYRLPMPELVLWDGGTYDGGMFLCPFPEETTEPTLNLAIFPPYLYNTSHHGRVCSVDFNHTADKTARREPYLQRILMTCYTSQLYIHESWWPIEFLPYVAPQGRAAVDYRAIEELTPEDIKAWSWSVTDHKHTLWYVVKEAAMAAENATRKKKRQEKILPVRGLIP